MLQEFDVRDIEQLSSQVSKLESFLSSVSNKLEKLLSQFTTHQHGGNDGSSQIYNESIKLKPGSYLQGGIISAGEGSTVEIKDGSITAITSYHVVRGEGGVDDVLQNINLKAAMKGQILILRIAAGTDIKVENNTGNLRLVDSFYMNSTTDTLVLMHDSRFWYEVSRSYNFKTSGFTFLGDESTLTIASGAITPTSGYHDVDTEGAAATDDLDTINEPTEGLADGAILVIKPSSSARTVVAKDGTGNLRLAGDFTMDDGTDMLTLIWTGTTWNELSRSAN